MNPILRVIDYFEVFTYPPTFDEVYIFLSVKMSKKQLRHEVLVLLKDHKIYQEDSRLARNKKIFSIFEKKKQISAFYIKEAHKYLSWVHYLPQVQFLGISGSLSMLNTSKKGDIDIFVISGADKIWTVRAILLIYKKMLSILNREIANKFCFNLFFSKKGLPMPPEKVNEYIGHELLQLKPIINKNKIYEDLLLNNSWVFRIFPNVQIIKAEHESNNILSLKPKSSIFIEDFLKKIQTWWLRKKNIVWTEKKGQLWLIQQDFQIEIGKSIKGLL